MKKINVKKLAASLAALSAVACMAAIPASAVETPAEYGTSTKSCAVAIGQATVTLDELKASNYQVPVMIKVAPNPKINILEFGISSPLSYTLLTPDDFDEDSNPDRAKQLKEMKTAPEGLALTIKMTANTVKNGSDNVTWLTWASDTGVKTQKFAVVLVDVPKDAKEGDKFDIKYLNEGLSGNPEICALNEDADKKDYVELKDFEGIDGFVKIAGTPTPTETTTTTTTTSTSTTTTTTTTSTSTSTTTTTSTAKPTTTTSTTTTTTTTMPVSETRATPKAEPRGTGILNPHKDEYYTQTTPKAAPARNNSEGTSPKTGASDVLPIAGAAAAVAVLGGVALVTKKKND